MEPNVANKGETQCDRYNSVNAVETSSTIARRSDRQVFTFGRGLEEIETNVMLVPRSLARSLGIKFCHYPAGAQSKPCSI
jgi:hypothetical protein